MPILIALAIIIFLMYKFISVRAYCFACSVMFAVCFLIVSLMTVANVGLSGEVGLLFGVTFFVSAFAALMLCLTWRHIDKNERWIFARDFFVYGFIIFIRIFLFMTLLLIPIALMTGAVCDDYQGRVSEQNRAYEELQERRRYVKDEAMKRYGAPGDEVTVNSTGDMVKVRGEWIKVVDK